MTWSDKKLGDFITLKRGYDLTKSDRRDGDVPVISSSGLSGYHDEAKVSGPGVITGRYGSIGEVHYVDEDYWPHNTTLYIEDFQGNHERFAYYFLINLNLEHYNSASSVPGLNRNHLHEISVRVPDVATQRRIADILEALDDKIVLNRQMNETLEAMAQTLYRHWFVDFGPFQDQPFVDSELGPIPEGWRVEALDDIADFLNGTAWSRYKPESDDEQTLSVIKIRELRNGFDEKSDEVGKERLPDKYIIRDGDIIFSWSGSLLLRIWSDGTGALNQHLFKVSSERYPKWFYYLAVRHYVEYFRRIAESKATTMGHIKRSHLSEAQVAIPPEDVFERIDGTLSPIMQKRIANELESKKLAETRDYLLPKLIAGEIEVEAAEERVESAAA
ncbi:MAG: restriction endonuclease subunit S [Bacteroidetes bacterium]|jgi:type I restriction enzyme S subunit|nr:restriction endonuclease subunit S [Bacteroidota bacterium]